ncbi:MAG: 30S ribosomal protein S4 [Marine Group II euryarchaeote MED-G38]|nr:30S ribosomal protein S4 [Euryarchaeota archaeon]OUV25900.1 MAG: 30S ribosomal protein S4 [Euryarchaeota archaeon TMED97]PDH22069.1 MAG: 30S ribosomal protein S4 [Marine Group II euryarchaeote MED-G38]|tara:strand:+ start:30301 stop:30984 length:684 start_codon:yes stop_codon:yes gene_type:complete
MGDPKFSRSKTQTPTHPWRQARIDEEHALKEKYGLKKTGGMKEIWKERTSLRRYRNQAMKLIGRVDTSEGHFAKEKNQLITSLTRKGLLPEGATVGDVLQIDIDQMLSRRLQSVVYRRGLAPTMRSSRQLIMHGHISIGEQKMTVPGYHILKEEEELLQYNSNSPFMDENSIFRQELERFRIVETDDREDDEVVEVREATEEFVEKIKVDSENAPTIEDTIPKEDKE